MKVGFSIRYKFLVVMSLLLAACVGIYLLIAVKVFKSDKEELVFDLNKSQVSNLASELDTQFEGISDKFKLFAVLSSGPQARWIGDLFANDSDVVFVSLYKKNGAEIIRKYESKNFRETYGLKSEYFEKDISQERPVPFSNILKNGDAIWNATTQEGPPLIGFGRSVVVEDGQGVAIDQMAVVGYVKIDRILKALSLVKLSEITIANREGEILAHPDAKTLKEKSLIISNPLFLAAMDAKTKTQVINFESQGEKVLGAFSKTKGGKAVVLAQASEADAFFVVSQLVERSLIFSLMIITAAFLAAVLLSRSLTEPLAQLVERMSLVSQGDLTTQIPISTKDETAVLASSFNQMIVDLKQSRDQLEEINRDLDQKVKERTQQLEEQNHKVKEAQEALIRTTRLASAGEIAGRAAHEVLNPLTSLLTRVGIMERKIKSEMTPQLQVLTDISHAWEKDFSHGGFDLLVENWKKPSTVNPEMNLWKEDLENIHGLEAQMQTQFSALHLDTQFLIKEGARINKIINGMRKLSNIRSDKRAHSAHEILKDCCHIMADLFQQRDYKILQEFHSEKDTVMVDRDEFVQAITNMMRNSLQALHEAEIQSGKKGSLRLVTALVKGQLHIYIEDSGVGVSPENQNRLFESQFTTKSPDEGTGLGLGISRRFVRGYGGDIEFVSSEPLQKTVFKIHLPIAIANNKGAAA
ncbi:MAG: ATP-binding protein [Pseudobdellovibrionaceae bacterium]